VGVPHRDWGEASLPIVSKGSPLATVAGYCLDTLSPNLNVDMVASSSGYHEPMSEEWREYFRELRGTKVFIYDTESLLLIFKSESIQYLVDKINIHLY
jgi:hypothetical protein